MRITKLLWAVALGALIAAYLVFFGRVSLLSLTRAEAAGVPQQVSVVQATATSSHQPSSPATKSDAVASSEASGQFVHVAKRGESVGALVHTYLPQTSFMTGAELEDAIRNANGIRSGIYLKPGQQIVIPGIEPQPIEEKSVPVAKDFEVRAVYLTGAMAASPRGLRIIQRWRDVGGNAVVFDVKDSDGIVNIPFDDPLNSGARRPAIRNLPKLARYLHSLGMHSIARIAIFRDERLVVAHPELAVQSRRSGQPWRENGKLVWTDPSNPKVQHFDIDLALAAAGSGVDEIQFDYVRFPAEGDQKDAQFHFQSGHPHWQRSDVITDFLHTAYAQIHPTGVLLSLDVFGIMAWQRPVDLAHTGQDIPAMAHNCDVLSPMIYPSHFFGMDGYAHPGDAPDHFIGESMAKFQKITAASGVVLRPWLQAFAWRTRTYSSDYIVEQVKVAREQGGTGFLFWNARNDYAKPLIAMPVMRANRGRYFRGDEVQAATAGAQGGLVLVSAPARTSVSGNARPAQ